MTRTDVVASSRPHETTGFEGDRKRSRISRGLSAVPLALVVSAALVVPTSALAASEGLSGYSTTPTTTTTTTPPPSTTPTTPSKSGTSPSKEEGTATTPTTSSSGVAANTETTTSGTTPTKSSTLPFTGFDLRWSIAIGFLLIAGGGSLMVMQRRQRRGIGR